MPSPLEARQDKHPSRGHVNIASSNPGDESPISMRPPTATHRLSDASSRPPSMPSVASSLPRTRSTRLDDGVVEGVEMSQNTRPTTNGTQASAPFLSPQISQNAEDVASPQGDGSRSELRYATMLSLLDRKEAGQLPQGQSTKLIAGTNPLSALLGKDLKHKIVTNSCSFRTPDPTGTARQPALIRGSGIHSCDWEQSYRSMGLPEPRLQYLKALDCFRLPSPARCAELLEIFFSYVHPMVPIIDRKDFLARYYGGDEPPSLVVLHAVFLSASRYANDSGSNSDGVSEVRSMCDELHTKLRALIEAEITSDRVAVIQASILASLHWEGREGLNSAIDNLSIAVRACQEMGLHRKQQVNKPPIEGQQSLQRRIWWCLYAMDRFNAAQEGTPFLINELDCDVEFLTTQDVSGEDQLTQSVTVLNLSLARLVEDAVRSLYMPGEDHTTLFSSRGALLRQRLDLQLEQLAQLITGKLLSVGNLSGGSSSNGTDRYSLFGSILVTQ
ncbi:hypothetical protein diail_2615 [Diaporthe ilicicola]|nr:hypothetical protein diail_2615 [Diaporthe ilicicola]